MTISQEAAHELLDALKAVASMDIKGHSLSDRLLFSTAGRALLDKINSAISKAEGRA